MEPSLTQRIPSFTKVCHLCSIETSSIVYLDLDEFEIFCLAVPILQSFI